MLKKLIALAFLLCAAPTLRAACPASVPADITSCYYIDFASGSDSNSGTTEAAPWKHAPGMTGTVAGVGPGVIDTANGMGTDMCGSSVCNLSNTGFIFKGGVSWTVGVFPWTIRTEGTSLTARNYWGVDPTWYTGGAWVRPIFNLGGSAGGFKCTAGLTWAPISYVILDNFEWTNLYWDHTCNGDPNGSETYINSNGTNDEIEHQYMHGWSHEAYSPNNTADACDLIAGPETGATGNFAHDNVIDGSDTSYSSGLACVVFWGSPDILYDNYITYVANGYVGEGQTSAGQYFLFYKNTCDHVSFTNPPDYDPTQHQQCMETNGDIGAIIYNNLMQNMNHSGIIMNVSTNFGDSSYIFNNVIWNVSDGNNIQVFSYPAAMSTGGSFYSFNNTIEAGIDGSNPSSLVVGCLANQQRCEFQNLHIISATSQSANCTGAPCFYDANNILKTQTQANSGGYSSGSTYAFQPTTSGGYTVGAGGSISSFCSAVTSANAVAGTACASDTSYGVVENASNHTVVVPGRTAVTRSETAPDAGAYQFSGGGSVTITPTSLAFGYVPRTTTSAAQSVTISNTTSGTITFGTITITGTNASDFSRSGGTCSTTLAASATCTIGVTLTPTAAIGGSESATLNVPFTGGGTSPLTASLSGTSAGIIVSPTSINFGTVTRLNTSSAQTVTLTNQSGVTITGLTSIIPSSMYSADFSIVPGGDGCSGISVPNGGTCSDTMQVTPTAVATTVETANLNITYAGFTGSPQVVAMSVTVGSQTAAGTPSCTPSAGTYTSSQNATCSVTGGAPVMCWRLNATPSTNGTSGCGTGSTLYTGPVLITATATFEIIAGGTGYADGPVASYAYVINAPLPSPAFILLVWGGMNDIVVRSALPTGINLSNCSCAYGAARKQLVCTCTAQ